MDEYDVFISHAWEDKESFVGPLVEALRARGLGVWYDALTLEVGDSLRESIDKGLSSSTFGVVVLSHAFFAKQWPTRELNGLVAKAMGEGRKVVLPVWHGIGRQEVESYSYPLADLVAARSDEGVEAVADSLERVVRNGAPSQVLLTARREETSLKLIGTAKKLISDPTQVVAVNDLTDAIARESFGALEEQYSANLERADSLEVPQVLGDYRKASFGLARLCALGANLGHPDHHGSWERALTIIAREPGGHEGKRLTEGVWQYPCAYLLYAVGVSAMQRGRLDLARRLLVGIRAEVFGSRERSPLVTWIRWDKVGQFVKSEPGNNHRIPLSENLYIAIQDAVMEYFVDEGEYARVFDVFEFLLLISHLTAEADKRYRWLPPARLMWRYENDMVGIEGVAGEFVSMGGVDLVFGGNMPEYLEALAQIEDTIAKRGY